MQNSLIELFQNEENPDSPVLDVSPNGTNLVFMACEQPYDSHGHTQLVSLTREQFMRLAERILKHYASPGFDVRVIMQITQPELLKEQSLEP